MNELANVLSAVLPVLAIAVAGVAMRKFNWLSEAADHSLLRVTINLLVPAFIFDKLLDNPALAGKTTAIDEIPGLKLWTDDFSSLYQILK